MPKDSPARIATLDGLRAISILIVLAAHAPGTRNLPYVEPLDVLGDLGVRTFFVISGFLITTLLLRERAKTGRISIAGFYLRRCFRIFPAFYVYLGVMVLAAAIGWIDVPRTDFAFAATYTMNFHPHRAWYVGHLWSLAVEEQFYLLLAARTAYYVVGTPRAKRVASGAIVIAPLLRVVATRRGPALADLNDQAFPFVFDSLAIGCVLAITRDTLEASPRYTRLLDARLFWLIAAAAILALSIQKPIFNLGIGVTVGNLGIALAIHKCVRAPDSRIGRFLELPVMVWLGALSYSLLSLAAAVSRP